MAKILIIEDNETTAEHLSLLLKKDVAKIAIAHTSERALHILDKFDISLILLDLELPDMSGSELLKRIRQKYNPLELPVIIISATNNENIIAEHLELGANDYICKPYTNITLKPKIKNLIHLHKISLSLKNTNRELTEQKEKYQLLAENAMDVIWVLDINTFRFKYVSPSVIYLTGFTDEEAARQTLDEALDAKSVEYIKTEMPLRIQRFMQGDTSMRSIISEVKQRCKNGNYIWIEVSTTLITDHEGNLIEIIGVSRNIEQRKQNEFQLQKYSEELQKNNADKDKFFSILAHDLKNPFHLLIGFSEALLQNLHNYELQFIEQQLTWIHETTEHTYNLLEDLLTWAKSQSGKMPYNPDFFNLYEICVEVIMFFRIRSIEKNILININNTRDIITYADKNMVKTILRNLISNALKYTNQGGLITISAVNSGREIVISVTDNGVGILPENLKNLFDISKKIITAGTTNEKGSGLGLIICNEFIERHKGTITVESKPMQGSIFTFTLPLPVL